MTGTPFIMNSFTHSLTHFLTNTPCTVLSIWEIENLCQAGFCSHGAYIVGRKTDKKEGNMEIKEMVSGKNKC